MVALAVLLLFVGATSVASQPNLSRPVTEDQLTAASALYEKRDYKGALAGLSEVVAAPDFASFDEPRRSAILTLQAFAALETGDARLGSDAARRATALRSAQAGSWLARFFADALIGDARDALDTLTAYATRWPTQLGDIDDVNIRWALSSARGSDTLRQAGIAADEALYDAHWKPQDAAFDGDLYRLAVDLVARHQDAKAAEVARQIQPSELVLRMSVDRRFEGVTGLNPVAAGRTYANLTGDDAALHPRSLAKANDHVYSLIRAGDAASALAASDQIIARADVANTFDDQKDQLVWTLNYRSWALDLLGRHDDAARQMAEASTLPEGGRLNVSQSINLGDELYRLNRPTEALAAVAAISRTNTSPYGFNAAGEVRACAAAELNDKAALARALVDLDSNRQANPGSRLEGLLCAGDLDQAAVGVVTQLADPDTRGETLVELQDYQDPPQPTAWWIKRKATIAALRQRPDVRKAVDAAGWIRSWPFPSPDY
jgi:hypothetical protein